VSTPTVPASPAARIGPGLRELARPWQARLMLAALTVIAASAAGVVPALVVRDVIDHNLTPHRTSGLPAAAVLYLAATALAAVLTAVYGYLAATVAQRSLAGLRTRLFAHLLALPASYHDATPVGDSISRATADVEAIDDLVSSSAATLLAETISLVTTLAAMTALSPVLTALSLLAVPPVAILTGYLRRRIRDAERATRTAVATLNTQLQEDLSAAEVIRAFGRQDAFVDRFRRALTRWLTAANRSTYYNAFYAPGLGVLSVSATALLLWAGGTGVLDAAGVSLGTLTAFVLLFAQFFTPLMNIGDEWQTVQAALAGAERVFAVLALPAGMPALTVPSADKPEPGTARAAVRVDNVSFGYGPHRPVLHDISLTVHRASTSLSSGVPAPANPACSRCSPACTPRGPAASNSPGARRRPSTTTSAAPCSGSSPSTSPSSAAPSRTTSPSATQASPLSKHARPRPSPGPTSSSPPCRMATRPCSPTPGAAAACSCPPGSASCSPWPAP